MNWIKSLILNGLLIFVSIAVTLVAVDVLLHFTPLKWRYMYSLNVAGDYFVWDPVLGYDISPNAATTTHSFSDLSYPVWSNSLGCYDYPYDGMSPYIYLAGDSFTWGYTPLDEKWGKIVERSLGIRALTCGVPAYGTRQEAIKAKRIIEKLPHPQKLIILAHFDSDAGDDVIFPNYTAYHGYVIPSWVHCDKNFMLTSSPLVATTTCNVSKPTYPILQKIKIEFAAHSVLYLMAKRQFGIQDKLRNALMFIAPQLLLRNGLAHENQSWFNDRSEAFNDDTTYWDVHLSSVKAFKTLTDTTGSKLLVVLIPWREAVQKSATTDPKSDNGRIKIYLQQNGIPYIDLLPIFHDVDPSGAVLYWPNDDHWSPAGNALAGKVISDYIKERNLLKP